MSLGSQKLWEYESLKYSSRLASDVLGVSIYILDKEKQIQEEFLSSQPVNPFYRDKPEDTFTQLIQTNNTEDYPIFVVTNFNELYFYMNIYQSGIQKFSVIAGPCTTSKFNNKQILKTINDLQMKSNMLPVLRDYLISIPVIDQKKLVGGALCLYYSIYNKKLDSSVFMDKPLKLNRVDIPYKKEINISTLRKPKSDFFHNSFTDHMDNPFYYLQQGDKEELLHTFINRLPIDLCLSKTSLIRHYKNLFIYYGTLAHFAAVESGVDQDVVNVIAESYGQCVEKMTKIEDIIKLIFVMLIDLTDRVHLLKEKQYSEAVFKCMDYIFKHLYEDIYLSDMSNAINLNPIYISKLFRKEVGMTIIEYIQKERVEESKKLLIFTNKPITDIATLLNFYDHSHYTRIFKRYAGVLPKQYRAFRVSFLQRF